MKISFQPSGPCPARLMVVGEAPGEKEVELATPFVGPSGYLLDNTLQEVGLHRSMCFVTNVVRERPFKNDLEEAGMIAETLKQRTADHQFIWGKWVDSRVRFGLELLEAEIEECRPTVVVALGNLALWALTGQWGIRKWRSSILQGTTKSGHKFKIIPSIHPAAVLREYPLKGTFIHDMRRVAKELSRGPMVTPPDYRFIIRPSYEQALAELYRIEWLANNSPSKLPLTGDIETRAGHIACLGLGLSKTEAICIPFMCVERVTGYWTLQQETVIVSLLQRILSHPNVEMAWQNGSYDLQYEYRWHFFLPKLDFDTMLAQHAMFSVSPKGLDYLSSLYCDYHIYWKDDGRLWDPSMDEEKFWFYNCEDCVRTFEIKEGEKAAIGYLATAGGWTKLPSVVDFQMKVTGPVTRMMLRGVRSDDVARAKMAMALMTRSNELQHEVVEMAGQDLNIRSPKQMVEFFYGTLHQAPIYGRNKDGTRGNLTTDDEALVKIASREPVLRPLVARIQALRSAGVFLSTFVQMPRDIDGRIRCDFKVGGTVSYRFASSENAFGSGGNLQNIPTGDDDEEALILLPNIKELFLPDHGKTMFDLDGDSADLRFVTGESGCKQMQAYFAAGVKPYVEIAKEFYRDPTITKHHSSYKRMKALCHGSNYLGTPPGLSERIGLPVHDIDRMQKWYFGMCPEIRVWQEDLKEQVNKQGWIENPFGYRFYFLDRISNRTYNQAVALIPQSSVGRVINQALVNIDANLPRVEPLLQVHDSLTGQFPTHLAAECQRDILRESTISVQCRYELVTIPMQIKTSPKSWGECK